MRHSSADAGRGAVRAERTRVEDAAVARRAPLDEEPSLARRLPERPAVGADGWFEAARGLRRLRLAGCGAHSVASVPSTAVDMTESNMPEPWATATSAPSTWRVAALAAELAHGLGDQEHAVHAGVGEREAAAVGVHGERPPPGPSVALGGEGAALALLAEAEVLEVQQRGDGEAVVAHEHVDVGRAEARHGEGAGARTRRRASW